MDCKMHCFSSEVAGVRRLPALVHGVVWRTMHHLPQRTPRKALGNDGKLTRSVAQGGARHGLCKGVPIPKSLRALHPVRWLLESGLEHHFVARDQKHGSQA
eukprot:5777955-Amphidinium_carterae.1